MAETLMDPMRHAHYMQLTVRLCGSSVQYHTYCRGSPHNGRWSMIDAASGQRLTSC
eukprot:CCRYP_010758-RA/>CCRYP_010758-RA protein AED:0.42 eAED:0.42 QI:111/1/0.5/1/0/0/2/0/55